MVRQELRQELMGMRDEDRRVRQELLDSGQLGGPYVPPMEQVHRRNARRLRELIEQHGWPAEDIAGKDGAEAAWFIAQHAVGEPEFQRQVLRWLHVCAAKGRTPKWHAAYLEDRIRMQEGRPQRFGTQWINDSSDGVFRPWRLAEPDRVNQLRAGVGLDPLRPIPAPGPQLPPEKQREIEHDHRWWEEWPAKAGAINAKCAQEKKTVPETQRATRLKQQRYRNRLLWFRHS